MGRVFRVWLRWGARPALMACAALTMLVTLFGCDDDAPPYKEAKTVVRETQPAGSGRLTGSAILFGEHSATNMPKEMGAALGADEPIRGSVTPITEAYKDDKDYIAKADIYWKLNWIKKTVTAGTIPTELKRKIEEIRRQADRTEEDDKKPLIRDILSLLEQGLEADAKAKEMRGAGINPSEIAWGSGRSSLEMRMAEQDRLFGAPSDTPQSTRRSGNRLQSVLDFESEFHSSPQQVRQRAFAEAGRKTDRLGHMLGLEGREANSNYAYGAPPEIKTPDMEEPDITAGPNSVDSGPFAPRLR